MAWSGPERNENAKLKTRSMGEKNMGASMETEAKCANMCHIKSILRREHPPKGGSV